MEIGIGDENRSHATEVWICTHEIMSLNSEFKMQLGNKQTKAHIKSNICTNELFFLQKKVEIKWLECEE